MSLEQELQQVRTALTAQTDLAEERLAWAHKLNSEQESLRSSVTALTKDFADRTTWAKSLESELQQVRAALAEQRTLADERTTWAKSLDAELQVARTVIADRSQRVEERTAWAKSLDSELQETKAVLSEFKAACAKLAEFLPEPIPSGEVAQLDQCRATLADLRRDLLARNLAVNDATGNARDNRLRAEAAEVEIHRLELALVDAQLHIDHLLAQARHLQQSANALGESKLTLEEQAARRDKELLNVIKQRAALALALARYENSRLCRLAARLTAREPSTSLQS